MLYPRTVTAFQNPLPPVGRIWSTDATLELSHYTARRPFPLHFHLEAIVAVIVEGAEAISFDGHRELAEVGSVVVIEPERAHANEPVTADGACYRGFYVASSSLPAMSGRLTAN